jgi:hypothetical protein
MNRCRKDPKDVSFIFLLLEFSFKFADILEKEHESLVSKTLLDKSSAVSQTVLKQTSSISDSADSEPAESETVTVPELLHITNRSVVLDTADAESEVLEKMP